MVTKEKEREGEREKERPQQTYRTLLRLSFESKTTRGVKHKYKTRTGRQAGQDVLATVHGGYC